MLLWREAPAPRSAIECWEIYWKTERGQTVLGRVLLCEDSNGHYYLDVGFYGPHGMRFTDLSTTPWRGRSDRTVNRHLKRTMTLMSRIAERRLHELLF